MSPRSPSSPLRRRRLPANRWIGLLCLALAALRGVPVRAGGAFPRSLADLTIEELMNESVTSVSKKEQRLGDAAAAIAVLSNEDLRHSGATTIMDALRLVPGLNVGQVNSREWAVSARGFNHVYANKLLVVVDGRAVYTPLFAGVFWDLQQVMLDDVDRIEVIRGPGATVWGANAVNGVINVVSRSARDTQGGLLHAGGGPQEQAGAVRYGGQAGPNTYYRVFAGHRTAADFPLASGAAGGDGSVGRHGGFRIDRYPTTETQLTWQADAARVEFDDGVSRGNNINTLGRWTRHWGRSSVELQAYFDRVSRHEATRAMTRTDTVDLAVEHTSGLGTRHNIVWGAGYREIANRLGQTTPLVQIRNASSRQSLFSAFLQDEFQCIPEKLTLSAGGKVEHNDYTGWEFQPTLLAVLKPTPGSTAWASVSRAVRTPSAVEGMDVVGFTVGAPFQGPDGGFYLPTLVGNAHPEAGRLWAYQAGYRLQVSGRASVDLALFYNEYSAMIDVGDVRRFVPGTPLGVAEIPFVNLHRAATHGGEASLTLSPVDRWRLTASYARLAMRLLGGSLATAASLDGSPKHQATLRSSYDVTPRTSLDVQVRHVSAIPAVAAYTATDFRLAYRWTDQLEVSVVGRNLFDPHHPEQAPIQATMTTEVPRQFHGRITWRF